MASALEVLAARSVTLEQAAEAYGYAEAYCDMPQEGREPPESVLTAHAAWFEAIAAAEKAAKVPRTSMGAVLVLDEEDDRFGSAVEHGTAAAGSLTNS